MAEASVEQARKAFDTFLGAAKQTASTMEGQGQAVRDGAKDFGLKAIGYAEKNLAASLDYAEQLTKAKDVGEVMRLHAEFVRGQMQVLTEQARELGQAVTRATMDATKQK